MFRTIYCWILHLVFLEDFDVLSVFQDDSSGASTCFIWNCWSSTLTVPCLIELLFLPCWATVLALLSYCALPCWVTVPRHWVHCSCLVEPTVPCLSECTCLSVLLAPSWWPLFLCFFSSFLRPLVVLLCRGVFLMGGFHWVTVRGQRASVREAPVLALAPHSSYFDALVVVFLEMTTVVAKTESDNVPIFGSRHCVFFIFLKKWVDFFPL